MHGFQKVSFLHLPTPLERLPRLSEELGIDPMDQARRFNRAWDGRQ